MENADLTKIYNVLPENGQILIALPSFSTLDEYASAYILQKSLVRKNYEVDVAVDRDNKIIVPGAGKWKPVITSNDPSLFKIRISTQTANISELSYDKEEASLVIKLKTNQGKLSETDVSVEKSLGSNYDAVITLGVKKLEDLQTLYFNNVEMFNKAKKAVVGISSDQEYFGAVNIVDVNRVSISELIYEIVNSDSQQLEKSDNTVLLAGLMYASESFQSPKMTPRAFKIASELISAGGDQQTVVRFLYKTKDFNLLKLFGRALARMATVEEKDTLYTQLSSVDFEKTNLSPSILNKVMNEVIENSKLRKQIAILAETSSGTVVALAGLAHANIHRLAMDLGFAGKLEPQQLGAYSFIQFTIKDKSISQVQTDLLNTI